MPFSYKNDVDQHLSLYQLADDVLRAAYAKPALARPEICPIESVNRLHIRQPLLGELKISMGMHELESIGFQTPKTDHKDIELLCDRFAVAVSEESTIENEYGDSMYLIAEDQGRALAKAQEIWILRALETTPLKIVANPGADDAPTDNLGKAQDAWHHHVVPHTLQLLDIWEPTGVAMHPSTWAHLQPMFSGAIGTTGSAMEWLKEIPGFECPVILSQLIDIGKIYVVSAEATGVKGYQYGKVMPKVDEDYNIRASVLYGGIYRAVASNFRTRKNAPQWTGAGAGDGTQNGNAGVIEVTIGGAFFGTQGVKLSPERIKAQNAAIHQGIAEFSGEYARNQQTMKNRYGALGTDDQGINTLEPVNVAAAPTPIVKK